MRNKFFPSSDNINRECQYWDSKEKKCHFPNPALLGRNACKGYVDVVCVQNIETILDQIEVKESE